MTVSSVTGTILFGSTLAVAAVDGSSVYVPMWALLSLSVSAIGAPIVNAMTRRSEKRADWKRQDEVAARVEQAAKQTAETAALLVKSNEDVAVTLKTDSESKDQQLKVIHTLVDGQLTMALQDSLDATNRQLIALQEIVDLKKALGRDPMKEALQLITATEARVKVITAKINERIEIEKKQKDNK